MPRLRAEDGQSLVEYVAAIALVGLVFGVLAGFAPGIASQLAEGISRAIDAVSGS